MSKYFNHISDFIRYLLLKSWKMRQNSGLILFYKICILYISLFFYPNLCIKQNIFLLLLFLFSLNWIKYISPYICPIMSKYFNYIFDFIRYLLLKSWKMRQNSGIKLFYKICILYISLFFYPNLCIKQNIFLLLLSQSLH